MNEMFRDAAGKHQSGMEKAFAIGEAYYEFYKRYPQYFRMLAEAENMPVAHSDDINAAELIKASYESLEILLNAVVLGKEDGSIRPDIDPKQASIFLIQSTSAMIMLPPGFELFLSHSGIDKDATVRFTLQALNRSLENTKSKKLEA